MYMKIQGTATTPDLYHEDIEDDDDFATVTKYVDLHFESSHPKISGWTDYSDNAHDGCNFFIHITDHDSHATIVLPGQAGASLTYLLQDLMHAAESYFAKQKEET